MANKRPKITMKEHNELLQARDWCASKGFEGFSLFYNQVLGEHEYRGTLPREIMDRREMNEQADEGRRQRDDR